MFVKRRWVGCGGVECAVAGHGMRGCARAGKAWHMAFAGSSQLRVYVGSEVAWLGEVFGEVVVGEVTQSQGDAGQLPPTPPTLPTRYLVSAPMDGVWLLGRVWLCCPAINGPGVLPSGRETRVDR